LYSAEAVMVVVLLVIVQNSDMFWADREKIIALP